MKLIYTDEVRLERTPDGHIWATGWGGYSTLARYLEVFSQMTMVSRIRDVTVPMKDGVRCDGPGVDFRAVPHYIGPVEYARVFTRVRRAVLESYRPDVAFLLRGPSQIAAILERLLTRQGHPYAFVLTADPDRNFSPGSNDSALRPLFRWKYTRDTSRLCRNARLVWYVTEHALQRKFPPSAGANVAAFSDVELDDAAFVSLPRNFPACSPVRRIVCVASFVQLYKGQDVLIRAMAKCRERGVKPEVVLVGDGAYRERMQCLSRELDVDCRFLGNLAHGAAIRAELDSSDLFVLPSRTEGVPRALIEAMARGLPCISSAVGGIPELLREDDMVPAGDTDALCNRIMEVAASPQRLSDMSRYNLEKARGYHISRLAVKHREFCELLKSAGKLSS